MRQVYKCQSFHLTSFVFDLDGGELDALVESAGLDWRTAEPQQVKDLTLCANILATKSFTRVSPMATRVLDTAQAVNDIRQVELTSCPLAF